LNFKIPSAPATGDEGPQENGQFVFVAIDWQILSGQMVEAKRFAD